MESKESGNIRICKMSPWGNGNDLAIPNIVTAASKSLPKMITKEMIIILLSGFYNECERCMYHTQYDTGMRIQEVIDITRGELPDEKLYPKGTAFFPLLVNGVKGRGGNKKPRGTIISRAVLRRIKSYHNSIEYMMAPGWKMNDLNKPVFLTSSNSKWKYRNSAKQFEKAVNRSCLSEKFTTHWLRHGTAYSVLGSNMHKNIEDRLIAVQKMLGHESIKTTEVYVNMNPALILDSFVGSDRLLDAEQIRNETFIFWRKSFNK
jgi:site-specific recombinase XerD